MQTQVNQYKVKEQHRFNSSKLEFKIRQSTKSDSLYRQLISQMKNYRPEIDGLRALAILPVILFHAGISHFSGGFVGVDIFFVISGYLITTIIVAELNAKKFSLIDFYERRLRRILPALLFLIILCIPFAWIILPPTELIAFSKSLIAVPVFMANIFFWRDSGYFESTSNLKPLLHTWSLAVEEQYYLLFPLFLIIVFKRSKASLVFFISAIALVSLGAAQWGSKEFAIANYFLLPTRIWEIAFGSLAALWMTKNKKYSSNACEVFSALGIILIIIPVMLFDPATPYPSMWTLIPVIGAALIIIFSSHGTIVGSILGNRHFVAVGLLSYGAYLWHQPLFAFSRSFNAELSNTHLIGLIFATFLIAYISRKYIELPFFNKHKFSKKFIFISTTITSASIMLVGLASTIFLSPNSESLLALSLKDHQAIFASEMDERQFIKHRIYFENFQPGFIAIGSSRIMQIGEKSLNGDILNLGVSGASIEDDITILDLATQKFKPHTVFIGADPWLFNHNSGQNRWRSFEEQYSQALFHLNIGESKNSEDISRQNYNTLLKTWEDRFTNFYLKINKNTAWTDTKQSLTRDKILHDGSRLYGAIYANKSQLEIEQQFDSLIRYGLKNYQYSPDLMNNFIKLITFHQRNRRIILVLSPYHPKLYDRIKKEGGVYLALEETYKSLAAQYGIEIIGSYDPKKIGCNAEEFFDGMHPNDSCMRKVFSQSKVIAKIY